MPLLKMLTFKTLLARDRKLRSVLQGITCQMIENVADNETEDMAQAITETPQWLSKMQVHIYSHIQYIHTCK